MWDGMNVNGRVRLDSRVQGGIFQLREVSKVCDPGGLRTDFSPV